jgi:hypothetical protein
MVVAAAPTVAATVVSVARNAYAVNGVSATKFTTSPGTRKNKLVATNSAGYLPSNIVRKIQNSDKLDGLDSTAFLGASAKAADSDKLDGLDSTAFLGAGAKAADSDKLDGLNSTDFVQSSARVTYVQGNGSAPANGAALVAALAAISGATAADQYLVQLEPGTYDIGSQELVLPPFVHLRGAGMTATAITGIGTTTGSGSACAAASTACVLQLNGLSEVRDVLVRNTGGTDQDDTIRVAIYSNGSNATLRAVHAFATGSLYTPAMQTSERVALLVTGAPPTVLDSYLQAKDGYENRALRTVNTAGNTMRVARTRLVSAGAGVYYHAVLAASTGSVANSTVIELRDSYLSGETSDLYYQGVHTEVRVVNTQLDWIAGADGSIKCFNAYNSSYEETTPCSTPLVL